MYSQSAENGQSICRKLTERRVYCVRILEEIIKEVIIIARVGFLVGVLR